MSAEGEPIIESHTVRRDEAMVDLEGATYLLTEDLRKSAMITPRAFVYHPCIDQGQRRVLINDAIDRISNVAGVKVFPASRQDDAYLREFEPTLPMFSGLSIRVGVTRRIPIEYKKGMTDAEVIDIVKQRVESTKYYVMSQFESAISPYLNSFFRNGYFVSLNTLEIEPLTIPMMELFDEAQSGLYVLGEFDYQFIYQANMAFI